MSISKLIQEYRCPEASYYPVGSLMLIGKADDSWYYRVLERKNANVLIVRYVRAERGNKSRHFVLIRS
jgi:hypothetical protein